MSIVCAKTRVTVPIPKSIAMVSNLNENANLNITPTIVDVGLNIILFFDIYNSIPRNVNIFTATVCTSMNNNMTDSIWNNTVYKYNLQNSSEWDEMDIEGE